MGHRSNNSSTKNKQNNLSKHSGSGELRLIAGKWRGRKLPIPNIQGLRPTPNRIRETIFNWLSGVTEGADCLDLFCGSGALGIEAASRGAASVVLVDLEEGVASQLIANIKSLDANNLNFVKKNVLQYLNNDASAKDIIFIDPPFNKDLINPTLEKLEKNGWLKLNAYIYVESESNLVELAAPQNWVLHRQKKIGQVLSRLYIRNQ